MNIDVKTAMIEVNLSDIELTMEGIERVIEMVKLVSMELDAQELKNQAKAVAMGHGIGMNHTDSVN